MAVGAVEGSSASQAAVKPVRGIAVFSDLMLHAEPSDVLLRARMGWSNEPGAVRRGDPVEGYGQQHCEETAPADGRTQRRTPSHHAAWPAGKGF